MKRTCDNCGRTAPVKEQMYSLKLEMYARAEPIVIVPEDLEGNPAEKMAEIVQQMETCDAEEATDQVHEAYQFDLCSRCRERFHRQLKSRTRK